MWLTTLLVIGAVLIVGLLVAGGFLFYVYWWLVQRPVPKLEGTVHLRCLDEPVEVLRDKHTIPYIYARNLADLLRAQGYLHAQDRLWQMEQNRRIARGTLAEVFGPGALDADRFSRIVGFRRAAQAELTHLDDETRQLLACYVEGVNAYITAHPGRLAAEFNLLRFAPEPWQIEDVLAHGKVMAWSLSVNWESELTRLRLLEQLGPIRAADLEPDYPAQNPIATDAVGSESSTRLLSMAGLMLNEYEKVRPWLGQPAEGKGSNSWAVAPKHSTSRRALLANDPHLALQIPGVWYENHLECPDLKVRGASMPGIPGVVLGHNESIAWGMTNALVDVQDLYIERPHPDDPTRFEYAGEWEQAEVFEERIAVRRAPRAHVEPVVVTRHGPLVSNLVPEAKDRAPMALRWMGHEPSQTVRALLALNRAQTWEGFQAALADWAVPAQNVTYADHEGNIGYVLAGAVPVRRQNLGLVPAPGWDGQHEWSGLVPAGELPRLFNPPSGLIVTANNKIVGDDYHHFLGAEFLPGWRAARLEEMLTVKERFSIRDMEEMQLDTTSKYAAALTPMLAQLNSDDPYVKVAIGYLRKWNYRMDVDSTPALIFHYTLIHLLEEIFGRKLGPVRTRYYGISGSPLFLISGFALRAMSRLVEILRDQPESVWYSDPDTGGPRTRDEVLYAALTAAVQRLRSDFGDNARRWDWGRAHQVRYVHPLGSVRLFRSLFNRGPIPVGGDATTPNQTYHAPNLPLGLVQVTAGYRQIWEAGVWDNGRAVTASGQSGHPLSDTYDDQITMWREGAYHATPWSRSAVEQATQVRAQLIPTTKAN